MKVVITYDIADTKKRNKVSTLLESFGYRVNYSVFELDIKSYELNKLVKELKEYIGRSDSVRIYFFSTDTIAKSFELNDKLNNPFEMVGSYVE